MSLGNRMSSTLLAFFIIALTSLAAAPAPPSQEISVAEFVSMVAAHLQPARGDKAPHPTPEASALLLAKAGVQVKNSLSSTLTSGDAMDIFQQLGISLSAQHPERPLGKDRAAALVATFGDDFKVRTAGTSSPTLSASPMTSGATIPTLEDLDACQELPKPKDCHDCCRALGTYSNSICGKACSNSPKASAYEPLP